MSYYDWIGFTDEEHHPLSLPKIDDASRCCFFLDFDGTLVEIAEKPDLIEVDPGLVDLLNRLYDRTGGKTVVVSGRRLDDLKSFMPGFRGALIGSHGAEREDAGETYLHPAAGSEDLRSLEAVIEGYIAKEPAVLLEKKPCSLVLHFRQAHDRMSDAEGFLGALVSQREGWHLHHAKMALEVMRDDVSKAAAIEPFLRRWHPATPVAIGDDGTDEGMFTLAQKSNGFGIKVGCESTGARHCLVSVGETREFLERLVGG